MTTGPQLRLGKTLLPGVLAGILFAVMGAIVFATSFGEMQGFPAGTAITSQIGYAMFDLAALQSGEGQLADTEFFLASFLLIAVVLDAALDASLVLAKREEEGEPVTALSSSSASDSSASGAASAATDGGEKR